MKRTVLIVDDEPNTLRVLSAALRDSYHVTTARNGEEAIAKFGERRFDLVLSDLRLPDMDGTGLLEHVKEHAPSVPFVMLTAFGTIERAVDVMKKGAYTFLTKPVNLDILPSIVREAIHRDDQSPGRDDTGGDLQGSHQFLNLVGRSKAMQEIFSMIRRVSKTDARILILGESGTGKELVARALHYTSLRADKPFIAIDCAAIPEELVESELFGYDKGAFTCAYSDKIGLIEMAHGGTLFFDEIGDLDFSLQKKLLRFLQEKELHRLGGKDRIKIDVRVVAATNRDIEEAVKRGDFREDLFYRLNVIAIHMPPLRNRREDIPFLVNHFLSVYSKKTGKEIRGCDEAVTSIFMEYDWPGNVRELENIIERSVILCPYDMITRECLPQKIAALGEKEGAIETHAGGLSLPEVEKRLIMSALEKTSWNQSRASEVLGISRKQLRTKMKNLRIMRDKPSLQ